MDNCSEFLQLIECPPTLRGHIKGGRKFPKICGIIEVFQGCKGVYIASSIKTLPCGKILGYHIHEGSCCCDKGGEAFLGTGGHFKIKECLNPQWDKHPCHAGDMPPLFTNDGNAFSVFYTDRFSAKDISGRTAVIHSQPDDFKTQPSGDSGSKIACGRLLPC